MAQQEAGRQLRNTVTSSATRGTFGKGESTRIQHHCRQFHFAWIPI